MFLASSQMLLKLLVWESLDQRTISADISKYIQVFFFFVVLETQGVVDFVCMRLKKGLGSEGKCPHRPSRSPITFDDRGPVPHHLCSLHQKQETQASPMFMERGITPFWWEMCQGMCSLHIYVIYAFQATREGGSFSPFIERTLQTSCKCTSPHTKGRIVHGPLWEAPRTGKL
jgi:hypothetical protein